MTIRNNSRSNTNPQKLPATPTIKQRAALPSLPPALSVIFFTTLYGAGYGLLAWLGVSLALPNLRGQVPQALARAQLASLLFCLSLSTIGLLASLGHLGKPL